MVLYFLRRAVQNRTAGEFLGELPFLARGGRTASPPLARCEPRPSGARAWKSGQVLHSAVGSPIRAVFKFHRDLQVCALGSLRPPRGQPKAVEK